MKHKHSKIQSIRWSEESRVLTIETRRAVYRYWDMMDSGYPCKWVIDGLKATEKERRSVNRYYTLACNHGGTYHAPARLPWFDRLIVECMMMKG